MKKLFLLIAFAMFCSIALFSQTAKVGKKVPNYTFTRLFNTSKDSISLNSLKGKTVILEFWATWCGPCLPAMRKLDSLQSEFQDDLIVITVSSDDENRLKKYIDNTHTKLIIAYDTTHFDVFNYKYIPHTILIDKDGIVRSITSPENINKQTIRLLIEDNKVDLSYKNDFVIDTSSVKVLKSVKNRNYEIILTNYNPTEGASMRSKKSIDGYMNGIEIHNLTLVQIFRILFDIPSSKRIIYKTPLSADDFVFNNDNVYNLVANVSKKYEPEFKKLVLTFLNDYFDVNARKSKAELACYRLIKVNDVLKPSTSEVSTYSSRGPYFSVKKQPIKALAEYLESFSSVPVIDKTGLSGFYDIELAWDFNDKKSIDTELKKYGLALDKTKEKSFIEVLEIYKKK